MTIALEATSDPRRMSYRVTTIWGTPRSCQACSALEREGADGPCPACNHRQEQRRLFAQRAQARARHARRRLLLLMLSAVMIVTATVVLTLYAVPWRGERAPADPLADAQVAQVVEAALR
jgi:hypothetical protein